eukprot:TRINITY_DN24804_c0_g1_i1.p1 TRINITY_DN24804_c0_g1~~TRINITY_DN24804_c0_g1_i1.p1  ORF type:complete len:467 (+),score=100.01 TRINITY_DN24804_c0_g1_i1:184-1584(+)
MSEFLTAILKRRSKVDGSGDHWENAPEESNADASQVSPGLESVKLGTAPSAQEWMSGLEKTPEEDMLAEALDEAIAERGSRPSHAPITELTPEDAAKLQDLASALSKMQDQFRKEQEQLGGQREELARREAEIASREQALADEKERQRQVEKARDEYPMPEWLQPKAGDTKAINIGVVGNAGVGKSLMINRLRRVRPHADGWAPVGVNETTMRPTMYAFPNKPQMRLWDLPGAGTEAFPSETYIQNMGLRHFDKVIIVTAGRFTSTEVNLRAELEKHVVPFFMVRTKIDIDVYNNQQDNGLTEQATVNQIREDLRSHGVEKPYLLSLRDFEAHDFPLLMCDLFPGLRKDLDPSAPTFCPGMPSWNDAWALPPTLSMALSGLQGRWYDAYGAIYLIQGLQAHVTLREGQSAIVPLTEAADRKGLSQVWWCARWYIDADCVNHARWNKKLKWYAKEKKDKPLVWWWSD